MSSNILSLDLNTQPNARLIFPERHIRAIWGILAAFTIVGFAGWVWYIRHVAVKAPADGTINVISATFGENCGVPKDNILQWVRSACSGKGQCNFVFDYLLLGNPAPRCNKQVRIEWKCAANGPTHDVGAESDPSQRLLFPLVCPDPKRSGE